MLMLLVILLTVKLYARMNIFNTEEIFKRKGDLSCSYITETSNESTSK